MSDRALIAEVAAGGIDPVDAEDMIDRVLTAIAARLAGGKSVRIDGVGRLGGKAKWQDTFSAGPARVEVRVAHLSSPAELGRGDPIPLTKASR